jgi:FixJ family two-component response regulator
MSSDAVVFVLDDDAPMREAVCMQLRSLGMRAVPLAAVDDLAGQREDVPGCIVAPLVSNNNRGPSLAEDLRQRGVPWPLIALARRATTADIVAAVRGGAVTVLDGPPPIEPLREAVAEAIARDARERRRRDELADARKRLASLTPKERDVLRMVVAGRPNKAMANALGASLRTIENRRREVFTKLRVRSVAELVTLVLRTEAAD